MLYYGILEIFQPNLSTLFASFLRTICLSNFGNGGKKPRRKHDYFMSFKILCKYYQTFDLWKL